MKRLAFVLLILVPSLSFAAPFEATLSGGISMDDFSANTRSHASTEWIASMGMQLSDGMVLEGGIRHLNGLELSDSATTDTRIDMMRAGLRYYPSGRLSPDSRNDSRGYVAMDTGWMTTDNSAKKESGPMVGLRSGVEFPVSPRLLLFGETGYSHGFGSVASIGLFHLQAGLRVNF